jgi:type II secretory ATPase GspE/PulE/Tfp pilus assembly ATPase PilB-like protein
VLLGDMQGPPMLRQAVELATDGTAVLAAIGAAGVREALEAMLATGAKPWPLAAALSAVIAQRRVRRLCPQCRRAWQAPRDVLDHLGLSAGDVNFPLYAAQGCDECFGTGYQGMVGVFSVLLVDGVVAGAIRNGAAAAAIERAGIECGTRTLREAAMEKLRAGETTLEELLRVGL